MISLKSIKNQKFNEDKWVEILFYSFPLWFIIGNVAVSINILLFLVASLFLIQKKKLSFRFNNLCWLLIIFFLYFFLSTTIQYLSPGILNKHAFNWPGLMQYDPIIKSLLLVRFIILIFVIDTLIFNKILDLKKLFLFSLICTSFVSFDIILQFITGTDLFGYKTFQVQNIWNSGPFGDEKIAGGYLKNFSFFSFFYIFVTYKDKKFKNSLLIFIIAFHLMAALLAGNRMPMILFLFGCVLIILLIKNLRLAMILGLLVFLSFFSFLTYFNENLKNTYLSFLSDINIFEKDIIKMGKSERVRKGVPLIVKEGSPDKETWEMYPSASGFDKYIYISGDVPKASLLLGFSGYNSVYRTSIMMWKEKPLTGFGLKSFRIKCWYILQEDVVKFGARLQNISCANHSHNYYLQLLSEAGIVGTSLIVIFFFILIKNSFYYIKKYNRKTNSDIILIIPVIISIFLEIWPLRSSGSFFTNSVATFFWFNVAILISANKQKFLLNASGKIKI